MATTTDTFGASTTVVFADLAGSTGVYEALGNARAAEVITGLIHWIRGVCESHGGRVVKTLGDGVLAVFPDARGAIAAVVALQRARLERLPDWPDRITMRLQIGIDAGEVIEVDGDCYGDAVNVASRLSGPDRIWTTRTVVSQLGSLDEDVRFRSLGPIPLRGRSQPPKSSRSTGKKTRRAGISRDRPGWETSGGHGPPRAGASALPGSISSAALARPTCRSTSDVPRTRKSRSRIKGCRASTRASSGATAAWS